MDIFNKINFIIATQVQEYLNKKKLYHSNMVLLQCSLLFYKLAKTEYNIVKKKENQIAYKSAEKSSKKKGIMGQQHIDCIAESPAINSQLLNYGDILVGKIGKCENETNLMRQRVNRGFVQKYNLLTQGNKGAD